MFPRLCHPHRIASIQPSIHPPSRPPPPSNSTRVRLHIDRDCAHNYSCQRRAAVQVMTAMVQTSGARNNAARHWGACPFRLLALSTAKSDSVRFLSPSSPSPLPSPPASGCGSRIGSRGRSSTAHQPASYSPAASVKKVCLFGLHVHTKLPSPQ